MSALASILLFLASLALSVVSSIVLAHGIDRVGARLRLPEGLLGLVTALGANAPETSTAVIAILSHSHDLGLGVILGSNIYNLAALLGLSAAVAGRVRISPQSLTLDGTVAVLVAAVAVAIVHRALSPAAATILLAVLLLPYAFLLALRPAWLDHLLPPGRLARFLRAALRSTERESRKDQQPPQATAYDALSLVPVLAAIILASYGMVHSALRLGHLWHVPHRVVGVLVLAALTGVPNVLAAVRLALHGRGSAVVSESLNSNSLNVLAGIALPALLLGLGPVSPLTTLCAWWMLAMTAAVVTLAFFRGGIRRWEGVVVITAYAAFVATVLARH